MPSMKKYASIAGYLADLDSNTKKMVNQLQSIIDQELPEAEQTFAYGIPTYKIDGKNIIHFAAYRAHIGLYPGSRPVARFKDELRGYKTSKGTIQLPLNKPLPLALIRRIVKFARSNNVK